MKKIIYLFIGLCSVLGLQVQNFGSPTMRRLQLTKFAISNSYVDMVNESKLVESAIAEILAQFDPHSTYSGVEEVKKMNEPLQGGFEGIGIQLQMIEGTLLVAQLISSGPSEKAGVLVGDRTIAINDITIAGVRVSTGEIIGRLRGPKDSKVNLTIIRRGVKESLLFSVKRDKVPILSLGTTYMIRSKTGYIRINRLGAATAEEFPKTLKKLQKKGMKDLILDLQGNGGGYLNAAIDLAGEFLGRKELIVYIEGRSAQRSEFFAKGNGNFRDGHLVVLVNEYSISASEVVTGAIRDWDRGAVIGRRSSEKGLVQRPIDLPNGSMVRLTTARYYTPAGRCIQRPYDSNINEEPGREKSSEGSIDRYNRDLIDRYNHGEVVGVDSIHFPDSPKCQTKELGCTVYGDGGIIPDYFVPVDTILYTNYRHNLVAKGAVIKTTMNFIENNRRALLDKYETFEKLNEKFEIDDQMLNLLREAASKEKIELDEGQYSKALPLTKAQLKVLIARDLWDINKYFQVVNATNKSVERILEILNDKEYGKILK